MNRVSLGESRIGLWAERKGILKGTKRCEYAQWGGSPSWVRPELTVRCGEKALRQVA